MLIGFDRASWVAPGNWGFGPSWSSTFWRSIAPACLLTSSCIVSAMVVVIDDANVPDPRLMKTLIAGLVGRFGRTAERARPSRRFVKLGSIATTP